MTRVLLLDSWADEARAELAKVCEVIDAGISRGADGRVCLTGVVDWSGEGNGPEGIIAGLGAQYDAWFLSLHPNVKFVASATTGLDHIDLDYCASHNIAVLSLQGETDFLRDVHATAEHTVALLLSLLRHIPQAHNDVCAGRWDREAWQGSELHGKMVGIVGLGRVGSQVANIVRAFGADTLYCDNNPELRYGEGGAYLLDEVLRCADIVSLHVPLNDSTRGMIGEAQLRLMKPASILINTSRGAVVDEEALLWALREGRIAGAALDVLCGEPLVNRRLVDYARTHDNLILTPHLGGQTRESRLKTQLYMTGKIADFIGRCGRA